MARAIPKLNQQGANGNRRFRLRIAVRSRKQTPRKAKGEALTWHASCHTSSKRSDERYLTRGVPCGIMGYWGDDFLATTDQEIDMGKTTTKTPAAPEATGTRIRPNWDSLTKVQAASGKRSFDNADALAVALRGKTLAEAYTICVKALKAEGEPTTVKALSARYSHLNPGHQRMCIGNKVRAAMKRSADGVVRS